MFYVLSSFSSVLPWQSCWHKWNDANCWDPKENFSLSLLVERGLSLNETDSPVTQFWEKRVLKTSSNIDDTGFVQWELALLLLLVWVLTYFALWKGITNSRKLVYVCAITPYILLFILLGRGLSLEGAFDGIQFFLRPNMTKLMYAEVWRDAGTQIFYSSGIGFGTLVALGSYNNYHHNVYRDALTLCCINSSTSITAGLVVFSVLGYMANIAGKTVDQVVKSGVGLAFLVYPEAISTLPIAQLWSVLFFLMIMILGLDSQVCTVEGVVLALTDQFPNTLRKHKELFVGTMCVAGFLLGLPMVCQSGQYWLTLVDAYGASGITLLFVVFFEIVALSWGFGANRIYQALQHMIGSRPCIFWYICWKFTAPLTCLILFIITIYGYTPLMYPDKVTPYPRWAMILGFLMSTLSMLMIPIYAAYYLYTAPGKSFGEKLKSGLTPSIRLRFEEGDKIELRTLNGDAENHKKTSENFSYNPRYSDVYDPKAAT
jgi:solute carrier family 6 GABA transporter-like protein 1